MNLDLVSIITPCYNNSKFISETIESVINQTYKNWEMIIVDDGSSDHLESVVRHFQTKDNRIKYIYQDNAGCAAARNNGIRHANGRYIALLDSDDLWYPNFLESQLDFMKQNKAVCVFSSYELIDTDSRPFGRITYAKPTISEKDMKIRNQIGCLTGLYDTKLYGKKYLDENLKSIRDDYAYWYDIVALQGKAYGNPAVLAKYRVFDNSTTGNKKKLIPIQYKFYRNYLKESAFSSIVNTIRWGLSGLKKYSKL